MFSSVELNRIPDGSGVYLMKDQFGEIIYIGKAINLSKRVKSYFYKGKNDIPKIKQLQIEIHQISFITTNTELEALILESNLIKKHLPKYNRQLKQYKYDPFIKINLSNEYPRIYVTRKYQNDNNLYLGPFKNAHHLEENTRLINKIFLTRPCKQNIKADPGDHSCLYYQIKQCSAPCNGSVSKGAYRRLIDQTIDFLRTGNSLIVNEYQDELISKQDQFVQSRDFESANLIHKTYITTQRLKHLFRNHNNALSLSNSLVLLEENQNYNIFPFYDGILQNIIQLSNIEDLIYILKSKSYESKSNNNYLFNHIFENTSHQQISSQDMDILKITSRWLKKNKNRCLVISSHQTPNLLSGIQSKKLQSLSQITSDLLISKQNKY